MRCSFGKSGQRESRSSNGASVRSMTKTLRKPRRCAYSASQARPPPGIRMRRSLSTSWSMYSFKGVEGPPRSQPVSCLGVALLPIVPVQFHGAKIGWACRSPSINARSKVIFQDGYLCPIPGAVQCPSFGPLSRTLVSRPVTFRPHCMHWIDASIFILYMIALLGVGFWFMRKNDSADDYFVGGRAMGAGPHRAFRSGHGCRWWLLHRSWWSWFRHGA